MDGLFWLLAIAAFHLPPFVAPLAYARLEREHRNAWASRPLPPAPLDASAYRSGGPVITGYMQRAPLVVRMAGCSSLIFGAMFVPGAVWALCGLLAMGAGLLGIPGLIIAGRLWYTGHHLLRGAADKADAVRRTALYSLGLNVPLLVGALVSAFMVGDHDLLPLSAFVGFYALLSIGQALLVRRAAQLLSGPSEAAIFPVNVPVPVPGS